MAKEEQGSDCCRRGRVGGGFIPLSEVIRRDQLLLASPTPIGRGLMRLMLTTRKEILGAAMLCLNQWVGSV